MNLKEKAVVHFKKAIKLKNNYVDAYIGLGMAEENLEKAITYFTKAIELEPSYPFPYDQRSWYYKKIGKEKEAKMDLDKFYKLNNTTPPY